jgi:integrase
MPAISNAPDVFRTGQRWTLVLGSFASFLVGLDALVVTTALPTLHQELGAGVEGLSWTVNAYALALVRSWRTDLLHQGRSELTAAKSYRLLRAILNTAVKEDRLLSENPCRMRGFDKEPTSERPTASADQVWRLAALMPRRFPALVIFAAFTGLRWGELVALRVRDVDLDTGVVHV